MIVGRFRRERRLLELLGPLPGPDRRRLAVVIAMLAASALLRLPVPVLTQTLIDRVIAGGQANLLPPLAAALIVVSAFQLLLHVSKGKRLATLREAVTARFHHRLVAHLLRLSPTVIAEKTPGYLTSRVASDATAAGRLLSDSVLRLLLDALTFVFGLGLMVHYEARLAGLTLVLVPVYALAVFRFGEEVRERSHATLEATAAIQRELLDLVRNVPLALLHNAAGFLAERHERAWGRGVTARLRLADTLFRSTGVTAFLSGLAPVVVLVVGGIEAMNGQLSVGGLVAFLGLVGYVFNPVQRAASTRLEFRRALAALERAEELFRLPTGILERPDVQILVHPVGHVELREVWFAFRDNEPVLRGVNLEAAPGELVALTGPSGVGKTTVLWLVAHLLEPDEGMVLLDGIDVRRLAPASVRACVTMVPQPAMLLDATIRDNILLGRTSYSEADVILAAERANALDFVRGLPNGFDTPIGEGGARVSGGEGQRIALARALLEPAPVVLLDEPSTYLDGESREALREALLALRTDRTVIVVTHDPRLLSLADRVVTLEAGRVVPGHQCDTDTAFSDAIHPVASA
ncbi:MAG: ABC transporter ATP-binding protein [Acidobacteria bacterium]|nr:ABC transporter ATP-binding protein [Acidobacteriota bacterium]